MGTITDEWKRFRRRRLEPLLRRFATQRPAPAAEAFAAPPPPAEPDSIEPLLVALIRAELRRRAAFGAPPPQLDELRRGWRPADTPPAAMEQLVTALLAAPGDVAARDVA